MRPPELQLRHLTIAAQQLYGALTQSAKKELHEWLLKQGASTLSGVELATLSSSNTRRVGAARRFTCYTLAARVLLCAGRRFPLPQELVTVIQDAFGVSGTGFKSSG